MVFRGIDAAASLKPASHAAKAPPLLCLPRHRCRGLIEARGGQTLAGNAYAVFRGIDAAASLKPASD